MLISRKWLNQSININDFSDDDIVIALNSLGFEVEKVQKYYSDNNQLVIGRVDVINKVEKSDHLNFCLVDIGEDLVMPVICGANNFKEKDYIVFAKENALLENGMVIQKRKILDYESCGMICSLEEMGIKPNYLTEEEKQGIAVLAEEIDIKYNDIGIDAANFLNLDDTFFEVDLTLNRSDGLGLYFIMLELARHFKITPVDLPLYKIDSKSTKNYEVLIDSQDDIYFANAAYFEVKKNPKIKIKERMFLKQSEFCAIQEQPFSNLAALASLETGQPIELIDAAKIKDKLVISTKYESKINNVKKGEVVFLDGNNYISKLGLPIHEDYAVKEDSKKIIALNLNINTAIMRKVQREFNLNTINMKRYIKPIAKDFNNFALSRLAQLLENYNVLQSCNAILGYKHQNIDLQQTIDVELDLIMSTIGGVQLTKSMVEELLTPLGFSFNSTDDLLHVKGPWYRTDINIAADIIEEVARLYGYDNIISQAPLVKHSLIPLKNQDKQLKDIEEFLINQGFYQSKTYSLCDKEGNEDFNLFDYPSMLGLKDPLSLERKFMRQSLLQSNLEIVKYNNSRNQFNIKFFNIDRVYFDKNNKIGLQHLNVISQVIQNESSWNNNNQKRDFYYIKGICNEVLRILGIKTSLVKYTQLDKVLEKLHPNQSGKITYDNQILGFIGRMHPSYEEKNKIAGTYFFELNLSSIFNLNIKEKKYLNYSKFNKIQKNITVTMLDNKYSTVEQIVRSSSDNISHVEMTDLYKDDQGEHISIEIIFNSQKKQLRDDFVNQELANIKSQITKAGFKIK